jgi:hypothetical protein
MPAAILIALPTLAAAQFPPPPAPPGSTPAQSQVQDRWPEMPPPAGTRGTAQPQQQQQPQRPAAAAPAQRPQQQAAPQMVKPSDLDMEPATPAVPAATAAPKPKAAAAPATAVTCGGVFGKDSTHLKLALKYDSRNIVYTDVDGPDGTKIKASVLYPNDPKRRLEVLWNNDAARSETSVIAINGHSQWSAPKGLKLGMSLAALEKLNGRPFKLNGFGPDGSASIVGWEGGALATLPGGCKVGGRLVLDTKAPADARGAVEGDKELLSNDANLKAAKPTLGEILIGY